MDSHAQSPGADLVRRAAKVFPQAGMRLMEKAFEQWPISSVDTPPSLDQPAVTFVIGHRGLARLPHLLATLRSIAGQTDVPVECVVVEQAVEREVESRLPAWVRYIHTPPPSRDYDYNRSWTLNAGARAARGELVVLHDNDMLVPRGYAAELHARMREGFDFLDLKRFTFYLPEETTRRFFESGELSTNVPSTVVQNLRGASIAASRRAYFAIGGLVRRGQRVLGASVGGWERLRARLSAVRTSLSHTAGGKAPRWRGASDSSLPRAQGRPT